MVVAAVSTTTIGNSPKTTTNQQNHTSTRTRPPLLPSEPENNGVANRRPKSREVTSRYLSSRSSSSSSSSTSSASSTASKRCPSPLVSRRTSPTTTGVMMTPASTIRRSQSVERTRRPVTPRVNGNGHSSSLDLRRGGELSAAQKMLFTSTRSLSVSFQGESFPLQVSKAKPAPSPSPISSSTLRKGTPERRKAVTPARGGAAVDHTENSKPERWPGRLRRPNSMSRSVDCTDERRKLVGSGGNVVRALQNSMIDSNNNRALFETRLSIDSANAVLDKLQSQKKKKDDDDVRCDLTASEAESVSSGSTSEAYESNGVGVVNQRGPRGIVVPARFWHETSNRLRYQAEPGSSISKTNGIKTSSTPKLTLPKKIGLDSPASSPKGVANTRGLSSPLRSAVRPASPSKLATSASSSPIRGMSPSRMRGTAVGMNSSNLNNMSNTPSVLSYAVDVRRGTVAENRVVDAHLLRLFHNRLLQWRFANARADAALSSQRLNAERSLYNAWITTSRLCESVRAKRTELQLLKQNLKLTYILKSQMMFLEESALMDQDYSSSLLGAIEALRASTLRLPVIGGARADVQNVKDAITSAVDVMQAMASSICLLLSKAGEANSLVSELVNVSAKEHALLGHCKDLLSIIAALQVKEFSLRTHILQLEHLPSSLT